MQAAPFASLKRLNESKHHREYSIIVVKDPSTWSSVYHYTDSTYMLAPNAYMTYRRPYSPDSLVYIIQHYYNVQRTGVQRSVLFVNLSWLRSPDVPMTGE